jgi:glycosyltransferase involved in cell wall biosynthesis
LKVKDKSIVTWQPALTDHQSYTFSALARVSGREIEANVLYLEHPERVGQGWTYTAMEGLAIRKHTGPVKLISLFRRLLQTRDEIHVFCSPWEKLPLMLCLFLCARIGCRYYLISEPYSVANTPYFGAKTTFRSRLKRLLRPTLYKFYGRIIRNSVKGVFAISDLAVEQYASIGIDTSKIVPFGYYVPAISSMKKQERTTEYSGPLRAAFVGSISTRKGIDTLVEACGILEARKSPVTIDVYGSGDISLLEGAPKNIVYRGSIPFGQTQNMLADYDLLVLLSRYDGWGVVVNEALLSGRPVVCATTVGAARLVRKHEAGIVVPPMDAEQVADALQMLATDPPALRLLQARAREAAELIRPEDAAETVWRVLQRSAPKR